MCMRCLVNIRRYKTRVTRSYDSIHQFHCTSKLFVQSNRRSNIENGKETFGSRKGVGITKRTENYSAWYNDVITAADMVDKSPVRGCMIMKPWSMEIWDVIKSNMDKKIKKLGVKSVYFPLLVPLSFLSKEARHVEGFAKECAVVTHHRIRPSDSFNATQASLVPDESSVLNDPYIIRPTSETIIWSTFSRWIHSYKDLPLKVNQWANVMRWEMRPRPFLRTSEFLWQEGHTAHSSADEAEAYSKDILKMYLDFCESYLAIPVISGVKSENEKFAGADITRTIEGMMQNGWALQCGTSHFLGTNFGTAFDVKYQSHNGELLPVWATSWGVSTRLIGGVIMTHSDDIGLVLPPMIAPVQVVLIPLFTASTSEDEAADIDKKLAEIASHLEELDIRCEIDRRDGNLVRPGAKFYEWERKGVPLRIVLGSKELHSGTVSVKSRISSSDGIVKEHCSLEIPDDNVIKHVQKELIRIQDILYGRASARLVSKSIFYSSYPQLIEHVRMIDEGNSTGYDRRGHRIEIDEMHVDEGDQEITDGYGFYLAPWCPNSENEEKIKIETKLTIRCFPDSKYFADGAVWGHYGVFYDQIQRQELRCFFDSTQIATKMAIFSRSF